MYKSLNRDYGLATQYGVPDGTKTWPEYMFIYHHLGLTEFAF